MTRHFTSAALAAILLISPAAALAQSTNSASSSYSDTKPRKVAAHKPAAHKTTANKTAAPKNAKTKKARAPAK